MLVINILKRYGVRKIDKKKMNYENEKKNYEWTLNCDLVKVALSFIHAKSIEFFFLFYFLSQYCEFIFVRMVMCACIKV